MNVQIEESWKIRLEPEFEKDYFRTLTNFVREEYSQYPIYGGSEMMTLVVGTGCSLSALLAAFLGGAERSLEACIACCDYVNYANDTASTRSSGPGSFHFQYLAALYQLRPEAFRK